MSGPFEDETDYHIVWGNKLMALKKAEALIEKTIMPMTNDDLGKFDKELNAMLKKILDGI